jgi:hypothetical protein
MTKMYLQSSTASTTMVTVAAILMNVLQGKLCQIKNSLLYKESEPIRCIFQRVTARQTNIWYISCWFLPPGGSMGPTYVLQLVLIEKYKNVNNSITNRGREKVSTNFEAV